MYNTSTTKTMERLMVKREFNSDAPIVLGLSGDAGTGKTSTADFFSPQANLGRSQITSSGIQIRWSHLFYALPLNAMLSIRRGIMGDQARDRMKYQIHDVLLDVFNGSPIYGAPPYEQLVEMVNNISVYPCSMEGKSRDFLQYVGTDLIRDYNEDSFVNWMRRKIRSEYHRMMNEFHRELDDEEEENLDSVPPEVQFGIIISDIRFSNEAELVKSYDNGILIKLEAREEVKQERLRERDGESISHKQQSHKAETSKELIDPEMYDIIIDTSDITLEDQTNMVKEIVENFVESE